MNRTLDPKQARQFLWGRINYERTDQVPRRICLDRMQRLLLLLDNPQDELCTVHIAGSKGKGSTTQMVGQILTANGLKVGSFTSPHLQDVEERIRIDGRPVAPQEFADSVSRILPAVETMDRDSAGTRGPTFFEIVTAAAWLHFHRCGVHVAVMEVGLGGRLDSTNVCSPSVTAITTISLDHTQQLGDTLADIAVEKAGIIKRNIPTVCGVTDPAAKEAILEVARRHESNVILRDRDYRFAIEPWQSIEPGGTTRPDDSRHQDSASPLPNPSRQTDLRLLAPARFRYEDSQLHLDGLHSAMIGQHQVANASCAIAVVRLLCDHQSKDKRIPFFTLTEAAVRQGIANARLPARVELLSSQGPWIVIDGAHNPSSIEALIDALTQPTEGLRRRVIFAATQGKDFASMLDSLGRWADELILTRYVENPRHVPEDELAEHFLAQESRAAIAVHPNPSAAWQYVRESAAPSDLLCATGSLFLAAELRPLIRADLPTSSHCASHAN